MRLPVPDPVYPTTKSLGNRQPRFPRLENVCRPIERKFLKEMDDHWFWLAKRQRPVFVGPPQIICLHPSAKIDPTLIAVKSGD